MKETFHYDNDLDEYFYKADSDVKAKWKSSRFMPRRASRILLEVTNVRVVKDGWVMNGFITADRGMTNLLTVLRAISHYGNQ